MTSQFELSVVRELAAIRKQVAKGRHSQLKFSSIENGGINEYDHGSLVSRWGKQWDGTHGVAVMNGPTPPTPAGLEVEPVAGGLLIRWTGDFEGGALAPMVGFEHVEVHVSTVPDFLFNAGTLRTTFKTTQGEEVYLALPDEPHSVCLVSRSSSGKPSTASVHVNDVTPLLLIDSEGVQAELDAIRPVTWSPDEFPPEDGSRVGAIHWRVQEDFSVTHQWVWDGGDWQEMPVSGALIAADSIVAAHIRANAISTDKLAAFSVTAAKIASLAIATQHLQTNSITSTKIRTGAITADKLTSVLILATQIVGGDPDGVHVTLDRNGFHAYRVGADGELDEVIRIGTGTDDFFGIIDANGLMLASIDSRGVASFAGADVRGNLYYKGRELLDVIGDQNKGIVGYGVRDSDTGWFNREEVVLTVAIRNLKLGRSYRAAVNSIYAEPDAANAPVVARVRVGDTTLSARTGPLVTRSSGSPGIWGIPSVEGLYVPSADDSLAVFALTLEPTAGYCRLRGANSGYPVTISIEDIGQKVAERGYEPVVGTATPGSTTSGGGGGASPKQEYTPTIQARWVESYLPNGTRFLQDNNKMYQGYYSDGTGDHSAAGFDDLSTLLSGASVQELWLHLEFEHWYWNDGGIARIGLHNFGAPPTTLAGGSVGHWTDTRLIAKPGSITVDLMPVAGGFGSGGFRGIVLDRYGSTDKRYYGFAKPPFITARYTK